MTNAIEAHNESEFVFNKSQGGAMVYERQRRKIAHKPQITMLMIKFHTFRHWKTTTE